MIEARVIRILDTTTVMLNVGSNDGVGVGDRFGIYTPTENIVDPETEEVLGDFRRLKASVVVVSVFPRFVVASTPVRQQRVQERSPGFGVLGLTTSRTEEIQADLPVNEVEIKPLAGGMVVHVGDVAELLRSRAAKAHSE